MIDFHFIGIIMIFIMIPYNAHSLIKGSLPNIINVTGDLSCQSDFRQPSEDYQLCAIRVYTVGNVTEPQSISLRDGIWLTNTFRPLIKTRNCTGFNNISDTGSGTCDLMSYEIADTMTLCICAISDCNIDLQTCLDSLSTNQTVPLLPTIISDLTVNIKCANISNNDQACSPPSQIIFINALACNDYIRDHSVFCIILTDFSEMNEQQGVIEENYQSYLAGKLHDLKLLGTWTKLGQTDHNIYAQYSIDDTTLEQCGCTQTPFCNYNISTCTSDIIQTETTNTVVFESTFIKNSTLGSTTNIITVTDSTMHISVTKKSSATSDTRMAGSLTTANIATNSTTVNTTVTIPSITTKLTTLVTSSTVGTSVTDSTGLSRNEIIGIVIGAAVGDIMIISLAIIICVNCGKHHARFNRGNHIEFEVLS